MIFRRQIISRSAGPISAIFTSNESCLGVDDRSGPFFDISRDIAMATDSVQKWGKIAYPLHLSLWHSATVWDIATSIGALTAKWCLYTVWKFGEIRSSNSRVDKAYLRSNYLKIRWTDFCILHVEWKFFGWTCRWLIWTFFDLSRDVAIATVFVQKCAEVAYPLHLLLCHSEMVWDIATSMGALTVKMMPVYRVKIS